MENWRVNEFRTTAISVAIGDFRSARAYTYIPALAEELREERRRIWNICSATAAGSALNFKFSIIRICARSSVVFKDSGLSPSFGKGKAKRCKIFAIVLKLLALR